MEDDSLETLWACFGQWLTMIDGKAISIILFEEFVTHLNETVKQIVMEMCGDGFWMWQVSVFGRRALEKAVVAMNIEEVLTTVAIIVGEHAVLEKATDWVLLEIMFAHRPAQQEQIREILNDKRPSSGRSVRAQIQTIFWTTEEEDEEGDIR
jgi:hypothetical protein